MLRFLAPYLIIGFAIVAAGAAAYGTGAVGVPAFYVFLLLGGAIACVGYARWDERQHPHR